MPPQQLPRRVRMQELFANIVDPYAFLTASRMTIFMLMSCQYIRLRVITGINRYPISFNYIVSFARLNYDAHELIIRNNIPINQENYVANLRNIFQHMHEHYSAEDDLHAILKVCAFTMNVCRYIRRQGMPMWYMMNTVMLLALFISGERFRLDVGDFDNVELEEGNRLRDNNLNVPILCPDIEPQETFFNENHFMLSLCFGTVLNP